MRTAILGVFSLSLCAQACGGDVASQEAASGAGGASTSTGSSASEAAATSGSSATSTSVGQGGASSATTGAGASGGGPDLTLGCYATPPPGAKHAAPPKPYTGGACPMLPQVTTQDIAFVSGGNTRNLWLVVPNNLQPNEPLPVLFLWHWLNASPGSFFSEGEVQQAADDQRFIAILPESKGDLLFDWPYSVADGDARLEEEAVFFDDMLACVSEQFHVMSDCVSSTGVSAGALFTDQLVGVRSDWIASFMSLSGGTGGSFIRPWKTPSRPLPGFVLWGGPSDTCVVLNFEQTSGDMEEHLVAEGNFFLECVHNCGHSVPPFEPPPGSSKFRSLWQFGLDHPFWLEAGQSPYLQNGLPADLPEWCGIGQGSATIRTGPCVDPPGCN